MAKYKKTITYSGRLVYNQDAMYELHSPTEKINISELLNKIYHADNNYIEIKIMKQCKLIYQEQGSLLMKKDDFGIFCYHINGLNLEYFLFNNVGEDIEITMYAKELEYVRFSSHGTEQTTFAIAK